MLLLTTNNTSKDLTDIQPEDFKALQEVVGGYIELFMLEARKLHEHKYYCIIINEDAKLMNLPVNLMVGAFTNHVIAGDVVLMTSEEYFRFAK